MNGTVIKVRANGVLVRLAEHATLSIIGTEFNITRHSDNSMAGVVRCVRVFSPTVAYLLWTNTIPNPAVVLGDTVQSI